MSNWTEEYLWDEQELEKKRKQQFKNSCFAKGLLLLIKGVKNEQKRKH